MTDKLKAVLDGLVVHDHDEYSGDCWVDLVAPGSAVALYHGDDHAHAKFVARVARDIIRRHIRVAKESRDG